MLILKNYRANLVTIFGFTRGRVKSKKECAFLNAKSENVKQKTKFSVFSFLFSVCFTIFAPTRINTQR